MYIFEKNEIFVNSSRNSIYVYIHCCNFLNKLKMYLNKYQSIYYICNKYFVPVHTINITHDKQ